MRTDTFSPPKEKKLSLKEPCGWFAAGTGFHKALSELSDGAFKLFAYLCLQADRPTGRLESTHRQLAMVLGKSKRVVGSYVDELQHKGVCAVFNGRNQYAPTRFQIRDDYWPYHREDPQATDSGKYIAAIREAFLGIGCGSGKFGPADVRAGEGMHRQGIPLSVVLDAMLLGTCRKYISWDNRGVMSESIGGLAYFKTLIDEVRDQPLTADYREYLRRKNKQLAKSWRERAQSKEQSLTGGCPDGDPSETVQ